MVHDAGLSVVAARKQTGKLKQRRVIAEGRWEGDKLAPVLKIDAGMGEGKSLLEEDKLDWDGVVGT